MTTTNASTLSPPGIPLHQQVEDLVRSHGDEASFLASLLEKQCRLAPAAAGALIRVDGTSAVRVLNVHPPSDAEGRQGRWLVRALALAPGVARDGKPVVQHLDDARGLDDALVSPHLLLLRLGPPRETTVVAAYVVDAPDRTTISRAHERLELTGGLLALHGIRLKVQARDAVIERLRHGVEILEAVNEQDRLQAALMALCNEIAAEWRCERVSIGFLEGRRVKTVGISHTERFDRRMQLVQDLEAAMEECFDQDTELMHPRPESAIYVVRATERHAHRHGPCAVASLPLRRHGRTVGVLTVERAVDEPLHLTEIESLRLVGDLLVPRLLELRRHDRWIGARMAASTREVLVALIGPRHTWQKLLAILIIGFAMFLTFARGEDHVSAPFTIAAVDHRVVAAPFDGRIAEIAVDSGDVVVAGETVLAVLDTADLQLELAVLEAERAEYGREAGLALRDADAVEVKIAEARLRRVEAEIDLLLKRIDEATIVAPSSGAIVSADQKQRIGAPVEMGEVLFEIASVDSLRADLEVPEDRIVDLVGDAGDWAPLHGVLASVSYPGDHIAFRIERVNPVAEVIDQRNVFRVQVTLLQERTWLRPGMQGVARVSLESRPYGVLWSRRAVNWLRMRLWI